MNILNISNCISINKRPYIVAADPACKEWRVRGEGENFYITSPLSEITFVLRKENKCYWTALGGEKAIIAAVIGAFSEEDKVFRPDSSREDMYLRLHPGEELPEFIQAQDIIFQQGEEYILRAGVLVRSPIPNRRPIHKVAACPCIKSADISDLMPDKTWL